MYHTDAFFHGIMGRHYMCILAVYLDGAFKTARFVNDGHSEEDVHQRGLTGAVFTYKGMDLAGANVHIYSFKDLIAAVRLSHVYKT